MYQIFNNEKCLHIVKHKPKQYSKSSILINANDSEAINEAVQNLLNEKPNSIFLVTPFIHKVFKEVRAYFLIIEAAGGLVYNDANKLLMIYRLGKWDLPKGKIERGEAKRDAAIREVQEECALTQLRIESFIATTYHIYFIKNQPVLKFSHWYKMYCADKAIPQPQIEEGISEVIWANKKQVAKNAIASYATIKWLLQNKI
ncbi:MAG: NUDIX domain-containing protein [Bacteroidia bacterium]|nr:NUDIX domain-containing protein [Bacteroidia bacterium]HQU99819.1 NUDIX domain-containing protein [Bacteroidia bacterium]